ncbi:hypothetical protein Hanom_Chr09g00840561 [Helianthus anomalus]
MVTSILNQISISMLVYVYAVRNIYTLYSTLLPVHTSYGWTLVISKVKPPSMWSTENWIYGHISFIFP